MKSIEVEYTADWKQSPMAYWVHIEQDQKAWYQSESFSPPAPKRHGKMGYLMLKIEFQGHIFVFTSKEQLEEFIEVMGTKLLASTIELSSRRKGEAGPNSHWLSRLSGKTKPWKYREKLVAYCKEAVFPIN